MLDLRLDTPEVRAVVRQRAATQSDATLAVFLYDPSLSATNPRVLRQICAEELARRDRTDLIRFPILAAWNDTMLATAITKLDVRDFGGLPAGYECPEGAEEALLELARAEWERRASREPSPAPPPPRKD